MLPWPVFSLAHQFFIRQVSSLSKIIAGMMAPGKLKARMKRMGNLESSKNGQARAGSKLKYLKALDNEADFTNPVKIFKL